MKIIEHRDGTRVRKVLIGLITDRSVLGRVSTLGSSELFAADWENLILGWCLEHQRKYTDAPGKAIEGYFERWAENSADQDTVKMVEDFLSGLSGEYEALAEGSNPEYTLDLAGELFRKVKLSKTYNDGSRDLEHGRLDKAETRIAAYRRPELGEGAGVDLFLDDEEIAQTFEARHNEALVEFPGALGKFFQGILERDSLVEFRAPAKSMKSFWLQEIGWQGMLNRKRVAFFEVGDMSKTQIKRRLLTRAASHPARSPNGKWPCKIRTPAEIFPGPVNKASCRFEYLSFDQPLNYKIAKAAARKVMKSRVKSERSYFRLSVHASKSINVEGMRSVLDIWAAAGWSPDCVIIDYADILAPPTGFWKEPREGIGETWAQLRRLSSELHCLVVTASQSDAAGYDSAWLGKKNFSDDRRKNDHVTATVSINMTEHEKDCQLSRLGIVNLRDGDSSHRRGIYVAHCLALADPAVLSSSLDGKRVK